MRAATLRLDGAWCVGEGAERPKPRLLDQGHYSRRTESAYIAWIRRYIMFHGKRSASSCPPARGAVQEGWITSERLTQMIERFRDLANQPGVISALPFGQAVGRKPR